MLVDLFGVVSGGAFALFSAHLFVFKVAISTVLLAASCRERGQGHSWLGTTGARILFWGIPVALVVALCAPALPLYAAGLVGLAAFIGMALVPHGAGQNLAVPWSGPVYDGLAGINKAERLGYMAAAWVVRLYLIAAVLSIWITDKALWLLPLAGIAAPAAYFVGLYLPKLPWRLTTATEWGEFLTGAVAVGLPLSTFLLMTR